MSLLDELRAQGRIGIRNAPRHVGPEQRRQQRIRDAVVLCAECGRRPVERAGESSCFTCKNTLRGDPTWY